MASYKLSLDKRRAKKDGTYPLGFRITHSQASLFVPIKVDLKPEEWDERKQQARKSHPNCKEINLKLANKQAEMQRVIFQLEDEMEEFTVATIRDRFLQPRQVKSSPDFFSFAWEQISRLKLAGRYGNAAVYEKIALKLEAYVGERKLPFDKLTFSFIQDFEAAMQKDGMRVNSISVYLRTLRAIFNKAILAGLVPESLYPFKRYQIRTEKTITRALTKQQMKAIEQLGLQPDSAIWKYRQFFILAFNLIGISFIDMAMLRWSSIQQDRIVYKRMKTGKLYSILLTAKAREILAQFRQPGWDKEDFILPVIPLKYRDDKEQQIRYAQHGYRHCNKYLARIAEMCGIEEKVTTYFARYSWANIAKDLGYSKDLIAEALGHEYGNRVTGIYLDLYNNEVIDEANGRVTGDG